MPVIAVSAENYDKLAASKAVRHVTPDMLPGDVSPVAKRLKLSYKADDKPTEADLDKIGLKLVEDYQRGSFMIVDPVGDRIDAALADKLEQSTKIQYATPTFKRPALPAGDRK